MSREDAKTPRVAQRGIVKPTVPAFGNWALGLQHEGWRKRMPFLPPWRLGGYGLRSGFALLVYS